MPADGADGPRASGGSDGPGADGGLEIDVSRAFTATGTDPFEVTATLSVDRGDTLVVLGPSGSGKTLLLETVAGFHAYEGSIALDGRDLTPLPPEERGFGVVFQDYALFPHRTVRENVAFGTRYFERTRDPDELLADLGVADLADRYPPTLSGGEKQRVALARSLAVRPDGLLLDEPLSALDVPTRRELRDDLADVLEGVTALYVTHNRTTARALADRIAVMRAGDVVQVGDPEDVFERPASAFVARFTGANCVPVADLGLDPADIGGSAADDLLAVRPEHVALDPPNPDLTATVERTVREDAAVRVVLAVDGVPLEAYASDPPGVGATVGVGLPAEHVTPLGSE